MGKEFLGRGWGFPVEPSPGRLPYAAEEDKIQQSILIILGTARGERVMRPDFGSRLRELVFAPRNSSTSALAAHYVTQALTTWEPRIDVLRVTATAPDPRNGVLEISIDYRVRATNSQFNLVYPFYLKEGSRAASQA
ncbi:MAG: GPW/gp25 family protein [Acidobacteria bacterium]|nr:GPW/gp25 family protein [Acidobacteriota bacterium]